MAPRANQDTTDLPFPSEDYPLVFDNTDSAITSEETDNLVESSTVCDDTKVTGSDGVTEDLPVPPCTVMVQLREEAAPFQSPGDAAPKKYGRKRKYLEGEATRHVHTKKPKVYEMAPLSDENMEQRIKNAIIAKRNRDRRKKELDSLAQQLQAVTAERDSLLKRVQQLMQSEAQLRLWLVG